MHIDWYQAITQDDIIAVKQLLKAPQVDESANWAIRWAAWQGHMEMVALLLQDPRVDPAADDNVAIRWAAEAGYTEVVALLLQDPRVDAP